MNVSSSVTGHRALILTAVLLCSAGVLGADKPPAPVVKEESVKQEGVKQKSVKQADALLAEEVLSCLLVPGMTVDISSEVEGVVSWVRDERGKFVNKGQLLMSLKSEIEKTALDIALARRNLLAKKRERNLKMFEKQLIPPHDMDEIETEYAMAGIEVKMARARLKQRSVYSPIDGYILKQEAAVGEYVDEKPVMTLVSLDPLHVNLIVKAERYGDIEDAQMLTLSIDGVGTREGTVDVIEPVIDSSSQTFTMTLKLPNPGMAIPAGKTCHL